jgi:HEAT repeat protein
LDLHEQSSGLVSGLALELACDLVQHSRAAALRQGAQASDLSAPLAQRVRERVSAALDAHDETVRRAAVRGLEACAEPADAQRLVAMLEHAGEELASAIGLALRQLARAHTDAVSQALRSLSFDWPGAAVVCELIADSHDAERLEGLRAAQASSSAVVRRAAVLALAKVHDEESAECVSLSLSDDDVNVRVAAAEALGVLGRQLGVDTLHGSLRVALDADAPAVVAAAARALALARDANSIPALREKLLSDRPGVSLAALDALRTLEAPLDDVLANLAHHPDEEVVKQALTLAMRGDTGVAHRFLQEALGHTTWHVRAAAVAALGALDGGRATLAAHAPRETDEHVRRVLEQLLEEADAPRGT